MAPLALTRSVGEIGKTESGTPAAAKTMSWSSSVRSMNTGSGSVLPNGATPPIEKPVESRTRSASARVTVPPPDAADNLDGSSWLMPLISASVGSPSTRKTRLLTIWETLTPAAAAASVAVRVPAGYRRGSMTTPNFAPCATTRATEGWRCSRGLVTWRTNVRASAPFLTVRKPLSQGSMPRSA